MPRTPAKPPSKSRSDRNEPGASRTGSGGELHQQAASNAEGAVLTTNQGLPISDDQNSLKVGARGPTLLEDFLFQEKITHFDHERIPERIVHARGSAAHGTFESYGTASKYTRAAFLQEKGAKVPVFCRFSTVAGGAGSVDTPRDVRGFAVKFYTEQGIFDLVGNNIPVFFIQDALKFPDLIHAVKMEPDRGFPQSASAHDTFWDFISLMPESLHMIMWAMSDRTLPRSLRTMEGFGVHAYRLVDASGKATFVKWHWRPETGSESTLWDEAVKLAGADPDFHRRDLFTAIQAGKFPAWELSIQAISEEEAEDLDFDILDATKLIPEEQYPLIPIGRMVLDRWPDNFFAETEQAAFHPGHLVPGIEFSDDPLLQGRIFSYTDTQLSRLGGPNFHEIPINRPRCPMHNFQRDAMHRMRVDAGRVSYEPNSLAPDGPRETPSGFATHPRIGAGAHGGEKVRVRSETFADHYSQARMFYRSMTPVEQRHMVNALSFELSKVEAVPVRTRMLGHLMIIDEDLGGKVADAMGMLGEADDDIAPARQPIDVAPSPKLSILANRVETLEGRKVGALIADGFDRKALERLRGAVEAAGALFEVVAPKIGGADAADGSRVKADHIVSGGPSIFFDAVAVIADAAGAAALAKAPEAVGWVADAFAHCKVIGVAGDAGALLDKANARADEGIVDIAASADAFIARAKAGRIWSRESFGEAPPNPPAPPKGGSAAKPAKGNKAAPAPAPTSAKPAPAAKPAKPSPRKR